MPDHAALYVPVDALPTGAQLAALAPDATAAGDDAQATVRWPGVAITITRMPPDEVGGHLARLEGYVRSRGGAEGLVARVLATRAVLGLAVEPGFDDAGRAMGLVARLTAATRGMSFLDGELHDGDGRALIAEGVPRPDAARVAERALALLSIAFRALLEDDAGGPDEAQAEALRRELVAWIDARPALAAELEPDERAIVDAPIGELDAQARIDAVWRAEGAAVLLWALGARPLPPHDVSEHPYALAKGAGLLAAPAPALANPVLRSHEELDAMRRRLLGLHWRIREHDVDPGGAVDLAAFARDSWFGGFDLAGVALADSDLAVAGVAITGADPARVAHVRSIATERHVAINWVFGEHPVYSLVTDAT